MLRVGVALFYSAVLVAFGVGIAAAREAGPPENRVQLGCPAGGCSGAAQASMGCNGCHVRRPDPLTATIDVEIRDAASGAVMAPSAAPYIPERAYDVRLTVSGPAAFHCRHLARTPPPSFVECAPATSCAVADDLCLFGFQLTAIRPTSCPLSSSPVPAGRFETAAQPSETQIRCGGGCAPCEAGAVEYVEHRQCGTIPQSVSAEGHARRWEFRWTAPPASFGRVHFFYAVNWANGDGTNLGDDVCFQDFVWEEGASN